MITPMSVNNRIVTAGLFQMEVSDDPGHHGCTICDLEYVFFGKFVSEALRWSLSWAPVLCSSLFPFLFRVIASPCGFLLASLYLRRKGPLWTHVFSSFILFFFILESLCLQRKGGHPPWTPVFLFPSFFLLFCFLSFLFFASSLLSFLSLFRLDNLNFEISVLLFFEGTINSCASLAVHMHNRTHRPGAVLLDP